MGYNKVEYCEVTFYDKINGAKKSYQIPKGSTVKLTNNSIFIDKNCSIDVILPQYISASTLDINRDGKLDQNDCKLWEQQPDDPNYTGNDELTIRLDKNLKKAKSEFQVQQNGGGSQAWTDTESMGVNLENMIWIEALKNPGKYKYKYFGIIFPTQK